MGRHHLAPQRDSEIISGIDLALLLRFVDVRRMTRAVAEYRAALAEVERAAARMVRPPWVVFRGSNPDFGWNQGAEEAWLVNVFLPFWRAQDSRRRAEYLEKWPPPSEDWRDRLLLSWVSYVG